MYKRDFSPYSVQKWIKKMENGKWNEKEKMNDGLRGRN
jgi:hypothetical protein